MDEWLQTMRGPGGYAGPISHWWEPSLLYCGPMADWRYEGLISGYITLFRSTRQPAWLERARQAGEDLAAAQLPSGKFRNSAFQQGPMEGGTPHEAAVDVGLLELALLLRETGAGTWQRYYETARRNITGYLLGELWDGYGFRDQPWNPIRVPNKNATTIEALVLFETLSGQDISGYLDRAAAVILNAMEQTGPRAGGTIHNGTGDHRLAIGIYTARSLCGLLRLYERCPSDKWLEQINNGLSFLRGLFSPNGSYFGRYPDGGLIANPQWVAGSGDLLRALLWGRKYGLAAATEVDTLADTLVQAQLPSGGIPTGYGIARRGDRHGYQGLPEFRDVLPVVGWCDKAFRALACVAASGPIHAGEMAPASCAETSLECLWKGHRCVYQETPNEIRLHDTVRKKNIYHWIKGACHPENYQL